MLLSKQTISKPFTKERMPNRIAIFTDLDGTLIRHEDYSFAPVKSLLRKLQFKHIPVVLASSKTRAEIEHYRREMKLADPFIVENGGAIVIPNNYFETRYLRRHQAHVRSYADSSCVELGRPYAELVQALNEIQAETQVPLIGFHEMDLDQIIQHTGLDRRQARLAAQREYDEPFLIPGDPTPGTVRKVRQQATRQGFRVVKGGRFYHLTGKSNKGRAVRILIQLYRMAHQIQVFIGLGDSENDLSLLQNVTVPILMAKSDGTFDATILRRMPGVKRALAGPAGWLQIVSALLRQQTT
jgi:mannosyl-3-phosphoglycerate phosphatase